METQKAGSNNQGKTAADNQSNGSSNDLNGIQLPSISLPKGGGAIKGMQEQFQVSSITGTSSLSIPIPFSPARMGFVPTQSLNYNSGKGNSPFGLGWDISIPAVTRSTRRKLPEYKDSIDSDTFTLDGAEDLTPKLELTLGNWKRVESQKLYDGDDYRVSEYRPRVESAHARIERWERLSDGDVHWQATSGDNVRTYYGLTPQSRITDPDDSSRIFQWMLCRSHDDKGNIVSYQYKAEDFVGVPNSSFEKNRIHHCSQTYIKKILYGNKTPYYLGDAVPGEDDYLFQAIFDYGEHDDSVPIVKQVDQQTRDWEYRPDPFSSYRAGFEQRTYRRCRRVLMFHCFESSELPHSPYLTKSLDLTYNFELKLKGIDASSPYSSFLISTRHNGHKWDASSATYTTKSLPELEIQYQQHEWNTSEVSTARANSAGYQSPISANDRTHLWVDLFSEGIAGVLTEQDRGWYYRSNLGGGEFSRSEPLVEKPSLKGFSSGSLAIQDLNGDGLKSLVHYAHPKGSFALKPDGDWSNFKPFESSPNIDLDNDHFRLLDLNGDGLVDMLMAQQTSLTWFPGSGDKGFELPEKVSKAIDEEQGPAILFEDRESCLFLADITGDGLTDIVRIRNGSICYWPNMGYGKFGRKVTMESAPVFDHPDAFNPEYIRLADIDGSGTSDVIYLGRNSIRIWMNNSGNRWSEQPQTVNAFAGINNYTDVSVVDFLGSGTASLVYRSSLDKDASTAVKYIDIMGSKKPGLLSGYLNNAGLEVSITYKSSTHFYLEDKRQGDDWVTTLPFPVHCIESVKKQDKVRETVFTSSYSYRHGYFDRPEKEFRGFARVEQLDTEEFARFSLNNAQNVVEETLHQPPVRSVSWFHTGAYLQHTKIQHQCEKEYFQNQEFNEYDLPEPDLPQNLSTTDLIELYRSLKGAPLRTEVYAHDGSAVEAFPYSASQAVYEVRQVQPGKPYSHASFQVVPRESISYGYERNPSDPRVSHSYTLEVDELGVIKKSASLVYPRVVRPVAPDEVSDKVWEQQSQIQASYEELFCTNDVIDEINYRTRVAYETKAYELSGVTLPSEFYVSSTQMANTISSAVEIPFETDFSSGLQARNINHSRNRFFKDDLSGPLPLGQLSRLAIPEKTYQLAFTKGLVSKIYDSRVSDTMLTDAQYVHSEGDDSWWTQTGLPVFGPSPEDSFYMAVGSTDVYGKTHSVEYDNYQLLVIKTTNAIGHEVSSVNDYRTLSPTLITDANLNQTAAETDELAVAIKTAVMGKAGSGDGDSLADPTTRVEYELSNWKLHKKPNMVHTFAREKHGAGNPGWQETYTYSDGGGNVIMTKSPAKPGKATIWNPLSAQVEEVDADPRWIGNGRMILNNKGNPVKQYQPYFSSTHDYESEAALVETGATETLLYDALGRNIRTDYPNGTFAKVEFDAWSSKEFDVNDTVKESQWFIDRGSPDPDVDPEPGDPEHRAAWLAAKHYDTPSVFHMDSLARPFYSISDHGNGKKTHVYTETDLSNRYSEVVDEMGRVVSRNYANMLGQTVYTETAEKGQQRLFSDVLGRLLRAWDGNSFEIYNTFDDLDRPVSNFLKESGSDILFRHIVYGETLPDLEAKQKNFKGQVLRVYDQSGVVNLKEVDFKGNVISVERSLNVDYKHYVNWIGLEGLSDLADLDTVAAPLLESEVFTSSSTFDALNRPIQVVLPDDTLVIPTYDEANTLNSLKLKTRGQGNFLEILKSNDYDAKGQRQSVEYGNGLIANYFYDPDTFRLVNLVTKHAGDLNSNAIQNTHYTYDPAGNIVYSQESAQQTHYFNNSVINPEYKFEYDSIYQLVRASGREHAGVTGNSQAQHTHTDLGVVNQLPHPNQANAVRNYNQHYEYDDVGNIVKVRHTANNANWTRHYQYEYQENASDITNRLKRTSLPGDSELGPFSAVYEHDSHGNMVKMPHLQSLSWNFADQLVRVDLGGGGTAFYTYGPDGTRTRKVIERQSGVRIERVYLGVIEFYREYNNDVKKLERTTIHVSDGHGRIAQIDTKLLDVDNSDPANLIDVDLVRYQHSNLLDSACIETDDAGGIISYEEFHPHGTSAYRIFRSASDASMKRYRFSGKERDEETGFYYFGVRYYAPWLGRWTSSDPGGFSDGLNLYQYVQNNPVNNVDHLGFQTESLNFGIPSEFTPSSDATPSQINALSRRLGRYARGLDYEFTNTNPIYSDGVWNFGTFTAIPANDPMNVTGMHTAPPAQDQETSDSNETVTPVIPPRPVIQPPPAPFTNPGVPRTPVPEVGIGFGRTPPGRDPSLPPAPEPRIGFGRNPQGRPPGAPPSAPPRIGFGANPQGRPPGAPPSAPPRIGFGANPQGRPPGAPPSAPPRIGFGANPQGRPPGAPPSTPPRIGFGANPQGRPPGALPSTPPRIGFGRNPPPLPSIMNRVGNTTLGLTRGLIPGVAEAEIGLSVGSMYAYSAGYTTLGGALATGAAYTPVVGGSMVAGAFGGNLAEGLAAHATDNTTVQTGAGVIGSAGSGALVGAAIGSVIPGVGTAAGAAVGAVAGLVGYGLSKLF